MKANGFLCHSNRRREKYYSGTWRQVWGTSVCVRFFKRNNGVNLYDLTWEGESIRFGTKKKKKKSPPLPSFSFLPTSLQPLLPVIKSSLWKAVQRTSGKQGGNIRRSNISQHPQRKLLTSHKAARQQKKGQLFLDSFLDDSVPSGVNKNSQQWVKKKNGLTLWSLLSLCVRGFYCMYFSFNPTLPKQSDLDTKLTFGICFSVNGCLINGRI